MKTHYMHGVVWALFTLAAGATPQPRTWTALDSRSFEGRFFSATDAAVTVARTDGEIFEIPLARLSEKDRAYVAEQREEAARVARLDAERVRLLGKFVGRVKEGILVRCEGVRTTRPRADSLARMGGAVAEGTPQTKASSTLPLPEGTFLVLDHPEAASLADYADVNLIVYPAGMRDGYTYEDTGVVTEPIQAFSLGVPPAPK